MAVCFGWVLLDVCRKSRRMDKGY